MTSKMPCFTILRQSCIWLVAFKECGVVMPSCTLASLNLQQQVLLGHFYVFYLSTPLPWYFKFSTFLYALWNPFTVNLTVRRDNDYWRHIYAKEKKPEYVHCTVTVLSASLLIHFLSAREWPSNTPCNQLFAVLLRKNVHQLPSGEFVL